MLQKRNNTIWAPSICNHLWKRTMITWEISEEEKNAFRTVTLDMSLTSKSDVSLIDTLEQVLWGHSNLEETEDIVREHDSGNFNNNNNNGNTLFKLPDIVAVGLLNIPQSWHHSINRAETIVSALMMRKHYYLVLNTQVDHNVFAAVKVRKGDREVPHVLLIFLRKVHLTKLSSFDCVGKHICPYSSCYSEMRHHNSDENNKAAIVAASFYYHRCHICFVLLSTCIDEANTPTETKNNTLRYCWSLLESVGDNICIGRNIDVSQRWDYIVTMGLFGYSTVWARGVMEDELEESSEEGVVLSGFCIWPKPTQQNDNQY
ncbi:hypothetical protein LSM04_007408 [Trypanosoma melophagium]|uniref:uncharacterized protein n=1 Tax=Trypanosoma melophagium TaxID=715481 RepID=UPI00351A5393|nr:hypothetical protein LSM04_007408 [Trypanosoma melophagium]